MATVTIATVDYEAYADVAFADEYLGGDIARGAAWAALEDDPKGRGLVSATRLLQSLPGWIDGVPDIDAPPEAVEQATSMLAADLNAKPALMANPSGASNVKRGKAGSAEVEFFYPTAGAAQPLPSDIWALLVAAGLIGGVDEGSAPTVTGTGYPSRFRDCRDPCVPWIEPYPGCP